jgi:transcriptional regulator with XRE-family HTH domain
MMNEDLLISKEDGIKLKIIRDNMGLSVAEFSEKTKINPSFINLLEKGCLPLSTRDKRKISETFELPENWFDAIDISGYSEEQDLKTEEKVTEEKITDEPECNAGDTEYTPEKNLYIVDGASLKATRTILGLSRKEIAAAIGVSSVQIGYIETGKRSLTDKVKKKLNNYLKTSLLTPPQNKILQEGDSNNAFCFKNKDKETIIYNISNNDIINKIKMLRKEKRYTQIAVSEKSGVNRSQLSMIENGKIPISKKVKIKLLDFISEEEGIKFQLKNPLIEEAGIGNDTAEVVTSEQIKLQEISANIAANKYELIKMIESMKKTRDELISNIGMLEKVLSNM